MTDIAELGLSVRSDGVVVATKRLKGLSGQAAKTNTAAKALTGTFARMATVAAAAIATAFSLRSMFAFRDGLAEVSTLVDTAVFSMDELSEAALKQAGVYGDLQGQVAAYYQIISAGASTVAQATEILSAANKLAIGGVTDIATAADGLTSVLNAYGDKVGSATDVSDAMFVAMRAGKTTIGELSAGLGQVAPLAAQTGVSFDELVGSVSALTKGGIATSQAMTGVRAILAAVAKPTSEAVTLSKKLGLEFNSTALASKGLKGFLDELVDKTNGSTDALAQLFGGVEALVPVMALSGQAGIDFTTILGDMENKAGATEDAFNKMAASPGFQSSRLMAGLTAEALKMSSAFGDQLVPALTVLADNVDLLPVGIAAVAGAITVSLIPAIISATISIGALTAAMLSNPFTFVAVAVAGLAGGLVYLNQQQVLAAQAADTHKKSMVQNANAIEIAKTSSQGFRDVLREQITAQIAAGEAAVTEARAQLQAAQTKAKIADLFGNTMNTLSKAMGFEGRDVTYGDDIAQSALDGLSITMQGVLDLKAQLEKFDAEMSANPPVEPVVHSLQALDAALVQTGTKVDKTGTKVETIADTIRGSLTGSLSGLGQALREGADLWGFFGNKALSVLDKITDKALDMALNGLFDAFSGSQPTNLMGQVGGGKQGGLFGGSIIPGILHGGGIAGSDGYSHGRSFGASTWDNAPRYHGGGIAGLKPNEVPAILERGERVTPANGNASNQNSTIQVQVGVSVDNDGNLQAYVKKVSGQTAANVVASVAPSIVDQSTAAAGAALGNGDFDSSMAKFGSTRQATVR